MIDIFSLLAPVFEWLQDWSEVISGFGSLVLSFGLLYLYFQQTSILQEQKNLRVEELNREVRRNHTETLRQRVRMWHGNPDREEPDFRNGADLDLGSNTNLPRVNFISIEPAPAEMELYPKEEPFRVVPEKLEGDRYLEDLLENHAPDLQKSKNRLRELEQEFSELRHLFLKKYDEGVTIEREDYTLEPASYFSEWLFNQLILIERGKRENIGEIMEISEDGIEGATNHARPEQGKVFIPLRKDERGVYDAIAASGDLDVITDNRDQIEEEILTAVEQALNEVQHSSFHDTAREASKKLDEAAREVRNLENMLIKYEGQQIYPGDCSYIEEESIADD